MNATAGLPWPFFYFRNMKKIIQHCLIITSVLAVFSGFSQQKTEFKKTDTSRPAFDTRAGYEKDPNIPAFTISRVPDSSAFTNKDLDPKKQTIIMVFGPECSHCKDEMKKLLAHVDLFSHVQFVMYAPAKFSLAQNFYNEFELSKYPLFMVGADPLFKLGGFFQISSLPTLFLYDRKGKFVKRFEKTELDPEIIAKSL